MVNFDLGFLLGEIKAGQEKIMNLLNDQTQSKSGPTIYDLVQLQEILHVSKRTVATWLKEGILPHSRVGGKIWISETQLNKFLESNSNASNKVNKPKRQKGVPVHE